MKKLIYILALSLYIASHYFLFLIWQYFLAINYSFLIIHIFLFFSIFSIFFVMHVDNFFSRLAYLIGSLWAALVLNSFLVFSILLLLNIYLNINYSVYIYSLLILFLFLIQFYSAYHIKIRKIKVKIKDLPKKWHGKKIVHISDIHLGPIWRRAFLKRLINKINNLKAEALFITGDMFDGMDSDYYWFPLEAKNLQVKKGSYYSLGNHDEYLGINRVKSILKNTKIKLLDNKMIEIDELQVIGLNCGYNLDINLKKELEKINYDKEKPSILLFHEPRATKTAKKLGIDLQLSGHTHAGQIFPLNLLTIINYPGKSFGLIKSGDYSLNVSSGVGTWGPPLRLFTSSEIVEIILEKK